MKLRAWIALAAALASACASGKGAAPSASQASKPEPKTGLFAVLETGLGVIEVRLLDEEAPRTVENFVALARGGKEWTDPATGEKTARPLYPGTQFSRVIPGFLIQGGGPAADGTGGPGYAFRDETLLSRSFDRDGLMAMANDGPDTNGSQFFITAAPAPFLNGKHTIFGVVVSGAEVVRAIAASPRVGYDPVSRRRLDRPLEPPVLKSVRIEDRK